MGKEETGKRGEGDLGKPWVSYEEEGGSDKWRNDSRGIKGRQALTLTRRYSTGKHGLADCFT
jgi:hypothetical protein